MTKNTPTGSAGRHGLTGALATLVIALGNYFELGPELSGALGIVISTVAGSALREFVAER